LGFSEETDYERSGIYRGLGKVEPLEEKSTFQEKIKIVDVIEVKGASIVDIRVKFDYLDEPISLCYPSSMPKEYIINDIQKTYDLIKGNKNPSELKDLKDLTL